MPESDDLNFGSKAEKWELVQRAMKARTTERHERLTQTDLEIAYTLLMNGMRHLLIEGYTVDLPKIGTLIPKHGRGKFRLTFEPQAMLQVDMALYAAGGEDGVEDRTHEYTYVGLDTDEQVLFERSEVRRQPPFGLDGIFVTAHTLFKRHAAATVIVIYNDSAKEVELIRLTPED